MKCEDVQKAIWSSLLTPDDSAHIEACKACQGEHALMEKIVHDLSNIDTPQPSKSLKPSREEIEKAIRSNKRLPFVRWTSIAASVAVVITAGTLIAQQLSASPAQLTPATPPQPAPEQPVTPPKTDPVDKATSTQDDKVEIQVQFQPTAENTELVEALKEYIQAEADPERANRFVIVNIELTSKPGIDNRIVAYVNLETRHSSGKSSSAMPFPTGSFLEVVQFARQKDGKLVVDTFADHFRSTKIEQTLTYFAQSLHDRNAVLQWALLTPGRQSEVLLDYEAANWTLAEQNERGQSVKSWEILNKDPKMPDAMPEYDVQLWYNDAKTEGEIARVQLMQDSGYWRVYSFQTSFPSPNDRSPASGRREDGIVFESSTAKVGDKIGTMTLKGLQVTDQDQLYSVLASFSGRVTITGQFQRMQPGLEAAGGRLYFIPDRASAKQFPLLARDVRGGLKLQFRNEDEANRYLGDRGAVGFATIEVEDYTIQYMPKDVWDQVTLVKVISVK
ncbi:hypothetical protein EV586_102721 [Tumebacillus sp. BK434]|uniref:hypothetical protein n=1 Tax=Tumebacillus sp. BK434 TaxID=2512169 RepID=UPI001044ED5E|nr:hypothetical protein [Tumebacillus sp. BK434]TCP58267.1 hypothetical protein EV586_102721 [Tumebacillus sp. BK434]